MDSGASGAGWDASVACRGASPPRGEDSEVVLGSVYGV